MTKNPYRKTIRLEPDLYAAPHNVCSITTCTQNGEMIFGDIAFGRACVDILRTLSNEKKTPIFAYCFMPDHIHVLLSPSEQCSIPLFIGGFKSLWVRTGWMHFGLKKSFWQKRYYDHFLRTGEDINMVAKYILNNPVRKGLTKSWKDYPLCGSLVFDL